MTRQLQRQSERNLDERRPDHVETSTWSGRPGWIKRLQHRVRQGFVSHEKPAKGLQATPAIPGVNRALRRHAREIEWCLRDAGAETMLSSGTLSLGTRIGDGFSAACIYIIVADNRIEYTETLDGFDYEQSFAELLPDDAELILVVPYSDSSKREATLYEVRGEPRRGL